MEERKLLELKCVDDIQTFFELNVLDNLSDEEELNEYISELSDLGKKFRDVHTELSSGLTADVHKEQYPDALNCRRNVNQKIQDAKTKLKKRKKDKAKIKLTEKENELNAEKQFLISQSNDFVEKIEKYLPDDLDDLRHQLCFSESQLTDLQRLKFKIINVFENPEPHETEISEVENMVKKVAGSIQQKCSDVKLEIEKAKEKSLQDEISKEQSVNDTIVEEKSLMINHLKKEIDIRCDAFEYKTDDKSISDLTNHQILEAEKRLFDIDKDFGEILDKITYFAGKALSENYKKMVENVETRRDSITKIKKDYFCSLRDEIKKRDISEEKLKNALSLDFELPKFSGYDSQLDIFTFKREFGKLVEPYLSKMHWADSLKWKYLSGQALTVVESLTNIEEIWRKLEKTFGDVQLLLQNKLVSLGKYDNLSDIKSDEKRITVISSILNNMTELSLLATTHNLENELYFGGGVEKVLGIMGNERKRKFIRKSDHKLKGPIAWNKIKEMLQKELSECEKLALYEKSEKLFKVRERKKVLPEVDDLDESTLYNADVESESPCHLCGKTDHVLTIRGERRFVQYFSCKLFVEKNCKERFELLTSKSLCTKCLRPGQKKGHRYVCYEEYLCPDASHTSENKVHVLLCGEHCNSDANKALLGKYRTEIMEHLTPDMKPFTRDIRICNFAQSGDGSAYPADSGGNSSQRRPDGRGIFKMQTIEIKGHAFNLFFDDGCGEMVLKREAAETLKSLGLAKMVDSRPKILAGAGGVKTLVDHGEWEVSLPLITPTKEGKANAELRGLCLDKVTTEFPRFQLKEAMGDIKKEWVKNNKENKLPIVPKSVGGDTDIMIGVTYLKHFPKKLLELESGLTLSESVFLGKGGSTGVVWGPHPSFETKRDGSGATYYGLGAYLSHEASFFRDYWQASLDVPMLGNKEINQLDDYGESFVANSRPRNAKLYMQVEEAGTACNYRCPDCRNCEDCRTNGLKDMGTIEEEVEQSLIEKTVKIHQDQGYTEARLPFTCDPTTRLKPNEEMAKKVYFSQVRKLAKSAEDKKQVIESEDKLQQLGFVDYFDNLSDEEKEMVLSSPVQNFIPWRAVWNMNSVSTECRVVFDATQHVKGGFSLNSILAKGRNGMNKLIEVLIRMCMYFSVFHCDIQKMYNSVRLDKRHWCYQLYLWSENLDLGDSPRWKVIKTLIYGVRSSGNQAECALRKIAKLMESKYKRASEIILNDTYVDDIVSGESDEDALEKTCSDLKAALRTGAFQLKGITVSGKPPPQHLSKDGKFVGVMGYKWDPERDVLMLNIGDFNFSRKVRGKKNEDARGVIPERLTRRQCLGKASEIFDPRGFAVPITSGFKIDLRGLNYLDWGEEIPKSLRECWESNFSAIQQLRDVYFKRAVVPENAADLDIETIDVADASQVLICAAVYARFKLKGGGYSCQLVFARSKLVPEDMDLPRAELLACELNATLGHVVKLSFGDYHKKHVKVTDSQVALHWIHTTKSELKVWVRNRVLEINRLAPMEGWRYVRSKDNIADMGTRKGVKVEEIGPNSIWINGLPWMSLSDDRFPLLTVREVSLSLEEAKKVQKERIEPAKEFQSYWASVESCDDSEVGKRYAFSDYVIDPNRFRFKKVLRILAYVIMFVSNFLAKAGNRAMSLVEISQSVELPNVFSCGDGEYVVTNGSKGELPCKGGLVLRLTDKYILAAITYFFRKGTSEVKHFIDRKKYERITTEKSGILYYHSRILSSSKVGDGLSFGEAMLDLTESSFVVPVLDYKSPISYALALETHRYHPDACHGGVETVLRYTQTIAFILNGRCVVKEIGKYCVTCRIRRKNRVKVVMGPLPDDSFKIAPAFFVSQVDIFGPYSSYSNANKRATVKIWILLHCCCVTGAVDMKVMEDYSTEAFLLAFMRFSCRSGYPKTLYIDEGSQLVKGCKDMEISFVDLSNKLSFEYGINFHTCPVGAHYMNGKAERKIQQVQKSMVAFDNERLSILQWESLMASIANSINNLPLCLGNKVETLENLDLITPNRLLLGRNNDRSPTSTIAVVDDYSRMLNSNAKIFKAWFKVWLVECVPEMTKMNKWFRSDEELKVGDVVLFLKSDKVLETHYQYGLVKEVYKSRDGKVRKADIEYQNHTENTKRTTMRGVRELVVINRADEVSIDEVLYKAGHGAAAAAAAGHSCTCCSMDDCDND